MISVVGRGRFIILFVSSSWCGNNFAVRHFFGFFSFEWRYYGVFCNGRPWARGDELMTQPRTYPPRLKYKGKYELRGYLGPTLIRLPITLLRCLRPLKYLAS